MDGLWKAAQNKGDQCPVEFRRSIHLKANYTDVSTKVC